MKHFILLALFGLTSLGRSQTTVYFVKADGTKDTDNYESYEQGSGKIYSCYKCKENGKDKELLVGTNLDVQGSKIYIFGRKPDRTGKDTTKVFEPKIIKVGFLMPNKKIVEEIDGKASKYKSAWIKDNKIYSPDGKLIAIIDGEEIYGAAFYLLTK